MRPDAPPRFSMMTGTRSDASSRSPRYRASMSPAPPGALGTMTLMGLEGYGASAARTGVPMAHPTANTSRTGRRAIDPKRSGRDDRIVGSILTGDPAPGVPDR